jgi:hypothetical protein
LAAHALLAARLLCREAELLREQEGGAEEVVALLQDFAFGINSTCLAHPTNAPLIGMKRQERECIAGHRSSELESRTDLGLLCMSIVVTKELDRVRVSIERGRPYGEEKWVRETAKDLGSEQSVRPEGRPRKASQSATEATC